jgi:hypothetical protein
MRECGRRQERTERTDTAAQLFPPRCPTCARGIVEDEDVHARRGGKREILQSEEWDAGTS